MGGKYKQLVHLGEGFMEALCYSNDRDGKVQREGQEWTFIICTILGTFHNKSVIPILQKNI